MALTERRPHSPASLRRTLGAIMLLVTVGPNRTDRDLNVRGYPLQDWARCRSADFAWAAREAAARAHRTTTWQEKAGEKNRRRGISAASPADLRAEIAAVR